MLKQKAIRGFTLIELMMVSAIIGLLAAIAIPKFGDLIWKAREAAIKGRLGALRSAVTIYYADREGVYPNPNPPQLFWNAIIPTYLQIPPAYLNSPTFPAPYHYPKLSLRAHPINTFGGSYYMSESLNDPGVVALDGNLWSIQRWGVNGNNIRILVLCTHRDTRGNPVSTW